MNRGLKVFGDPPSLSSDGQDFKDFNEEHAAPPPLIVIVFLLCLSGFAHPAVPNVSMVTAAVNAAISALYINAGQRLKKINRNM